MERLRELDALRAFALFGILAVNIWFFADPWTLSGGSSPAHDSPADIAVRFATTVLFEGKFYLLFSFLFGYSFVLQEGAARRSGVSPVSRTLRRLGALAVLGVLHGLLLYYGDILLTYALMGLILMGMRTASVRAAVTAAVIIMGLLAALLIVTGLLLAVANAPLDGGGPGPDLEALTGSPASALALNVESYLLTLPAVVLFQGPLSLAMFYLGFAAARRRLLEEPVSSAVLRRVTLYCLPAGLLASAFQSYLVHYADRERFSVLATGISTLTAPLLTAAYVCLLLLAFRTVPGRAVQEALAPAGRMALTNYLGQSLVLALLFTGYGLGLADVLPPAGVLGAAVAVFTVQLVLSPMWLRRFGNGPAEALLRRVTYGSRESSRHR